MTRVRTRTTPPAAPAAPVEQPRSAIQRNARPPAPKPETSPQPRQRLRTRADAAQPATVAAAPATVVVEREHRTAGELSTVEHHTVEHPMRRMPDGTFTPAMVRVSGGATVQPRQYESVRIGVDVTLPCYPDAAGIAGAYAEALAFVTEKVDEQLAQI